MRATCLILFGVMAIAGCASRNTYASAPDSNDPAWTPPGEVNLTVHNEHAAKSPMPKTWTAVSALEPNRQPIRPHQIRAARTDIKAFSP